MASPSLVDLDFDSIREELKTFLGNQSEFTDYDFDGSGLSVLLDILAYNTHMNALMAHMTLNESFLNTAQVRSNVVSHAQLLGYTPRSIRASSVELDIVVTGDALSASTLTLPAGYTFTGKVNNTTYSFVVFNSVTANKSVDNTYTFNNIPVYQGSIKTERYNVDNLIQFQKFEINSTSVDTSTLKVTVFDNASDTIGDDYTLFTSLADISGDSFVYFLQENVFGRYDVYFGDGSVGSKPANGSIVELKYVATSGEEANNITSLSAGDAIGGISNITVSFSSGFDKTTGGAPAEDIESIRYNAPIINATQDRAVTANDYASLLLANFTELSDVSVWGGEQAQPPVYGKVFITPALVSGNLPNQSLKDAIIAFLRTKNIGAILPEIVDPEYTNIQLFVGVKYDQNLTTKTVGELESLVRTKINEYNSQKLNLFGGVLRQSELLGEIDDLDDGIVSSVIRPTMYKTFTPNPTQSSTYNILFPSKIYITPDEEFSVTSSTFTIDGVSAKIGDEPIENSTTQRRLYFYDAASEIKLQNYTDVGTVNSETGYVTINAIKFDTSNDIQIFVKPDAFDIAPKFNQLIQIDASDVSVTMSEDTISANGLSGSPNYVTFSRFE